MINTLAQLAQTATQAAKALASPDLLATLFPRLEVLAVAGVRQNFDRASAPDYSPWPPLKRRQGRPLVRTGALYASMEARADASGVTVFSPLPYAATQDRGSARRNIPARTFLGLSQGALDGIAGAVADFLAGRLLRG